MGFKFLHAADLHLDSPLLGLTQRAPEAAEMIAAASRRALDGLVELAISEGCAFVVLAGDVFDGKLQEIRSGHFLLSRLRRLKEAGIKVVIALGNHDAENSFMRKLEYADNVTLLSSAAPQTVVFEDAGAAIHGRSFPQRDVTENLAREYPPALDGLFNIGVLHTACAGTSGHEPYAPCTVEQLARHGYDYWALGHVHRHQVLHERPWIVYPGNLQGRKASEAGPKGAMIVEVDGRAASLSHRALDTVRWERCAVRVPAEATRDAVVSAVADAVEKALSSAGERALAVRVSLEGRTALDGELRRGALALREEIETALTGLSSRAWLERVEVETQPVERRLPVDATIAGRLEEEIGRLARDWAPGRTEALVAEIREKLPAALRQGPLWDEIAHQAPLRAAALARALLAYGSG